MLADKITYNYISKNPPKSSCYFIAKQWDAPPLFVCPFLNTFLGFQSLRTARGERLSGSLPWPDWSFFLVLLFSWESKCSQTFKWGGRVFSFPLLPASAWLIRRSPAKFWMCHSRERRERRERRRENSGTAIMTGLTSVCTWGSLYQALFTTVKQYPLIPYPFICVVSSHWRNKAWLIKCPLWPMNHVMCEKKYLLTTSIFLLRRLLLVSPKIIFA